jgi:hypothetical protein
MPQVAATTTVAFVVLAAGHDGGVGVEDERAGTRRHGWAEVRCGETEHARVTEGQRRFSRMRRTCRRIASIRS